MKKILLVAGVALALALLSDSTRPRVVAFFRPVLDPAFGWSTRGEIRRLVRDLSTSWERGRELPRPSEFGTWMSERYQAGASQDAWGNPYRLEIYPDSFVIVSSGSDGEPATGDDIRIGEPLERRRPGP